MDKKIFAQRLKEARLSSNLTQTELSKTSGVTSATISAYESPDGNKGKNPSLDNALKLAQTLGVSLDWLCGAIVSNDKIQITDFLKMLVKLYNHGYSVTIDAVDFAQEENQKKFPQVWGSITRDIEEFLDYKNHAEYCHETFHYRVEMLSFGSGYIDNFLREWNKMRVLYKSGTIDENLYNLWLNQQFKKIDQKQKEVYEVGEEFCQQEDCENSTKNDNKTDD